jgi:hypothetical protein
VVGALLRVLGLPGATPITAEGVRHVGLGGDESRDDRSDRFLPFVGDPLDSRLLLSGNSYSDGESFGHI